MDREQALKIITEVCAAFTGNLAQHQQIQTALRALTQDDSSNGHHEKIEETTPA